MKQRIITLFCICLLLFLLVHPEEALLSAKDGMSLWLNVMIPTLLPFLILTGILLKTGNIPQLLEPLAPFWKHFFGISPAGAYVLILGFLCGYPMGGKTCPWPLHKSSDFTKGGWISAYFFLQCQSGFYIFLPFPKYSGRQNPSTLASADLTVCRFRLHAFLSFSGISRKYS